MSGIELPSSALPLDPDAYPATLGTRRVLGTVSRSTGNRGEETEKGERWQSLEGQRRGRGARDMARRAARGERRTEATQEERKQGREGGQSESAGGEDRRRRQPGAQGRGRDSTRAEAQEMGVPSPPSCHRYRTRCGVLSAPSSLSASLGHRRERVVDARMTIAFPTTRPPAPTCHARRACAYPHVTGV